MLAAGASLVGAATAESAVRLLSITSPVAAGERATPTVAVSPARACGITLRYRDRRSRAAGLAARSPTAGRVSWTWRVEADAPPGRWPVEVDCGPSGSLRTSLVVTCARGFARSAVGGRPVCRPAADLRVTAGASPDANRVGGTFTYTVTVENAGRAAAGRVLLAAGAPAEHVSVSSDTGSCAAGDGGTQIRCELGTLPPGARTPGSGMLFAFTDNGTPGAGRDTTATYFSAADCADFLARGGGPELALLDGDFVVRDERA